jgi:ATP-dependent DNA ligase
MKVGIESAVDVVWPDLIKPFGVQLANEMKEDELAVPTKKEPWRVWPVAVQAKLDGMRVIIDYNATTAAAQAFSREGHLLERIQPLVDLLADHFEATGAPTCRVDCEAFLRDWNTTLSLVKKEDVPEADRLKLRFYCFDVIREIPDDPAPYRERYSHLQKLLKGAPEQYVTLATAESSDMDSLMAVYNEMLDQGHEGVMVKYWAAPYRAKRTSAWLKLKPTQTIDAEIVDFDPGKDGSKYRHSLGAFVVKRHDTGAVVRVGGGLSDKDREALWAKKDSLLGKTIEFKEQGARGQVAKTSFPRFLRLREDR